MGNVSMKPEQVIDKIRKSSSTNSELGKNFEKFSMKFLTTDPVWKEQFIRVVPFSEWAQKNSFRANDIGIDLVGELIEDKGFVAIQCKCYQTDYRIQIGDLSNFIASATRTPFTKMLFIDTTEGAWGSNAEELVRARTDFKRINLEHLRNSSIDWEDFSNNFLKDGKVKLLPAKVIRPHQEEAISNVLLGFKKFDRGKMVMACGTGKTFTSLKIAEEIAGKGGRVLLLVPSLALMSQTIREWFADSVVQLRAVAVCSDAQVGKSGTIKRVNNDKIDENTDIDVRDLAIPVTTDHQELANQISGVDLKRMSVVFSTYQSISVVSNAQLKNEFPEFDLIICDEAHRTTGVKFAGQDDGNFVKVHNNLFIKGIKRLYMTATPRIFSEKAKAKAGDLEAVLCSMDNEEQYGPIFHTLNFGKAVTENLLTDYKVVVLAMDQQIVSRTVQNKLEDSGELRLDEATKIVGCFRALQKHGDRFLADNSPMRRAIMFCENINASKLISEKFETIARAFKNSNFFTTDESNLISNNDSTYELDCQVEHVDGTFNSKERDKLLNWLREVEGKEHECRILSNARCLSEGVDVPDLDAIMFMHPRKSQIDIVQAVGRVMRKAKGKNIGYIILPVVIPAGGSASKSLADNKNYGIVWSVLNALRSHDDRFDASINKFELNGHFGGRIEVIAEIADIEQKKIKTYPPIGEGTKRPAGKEWDEPLPPQLGLEFDEFTAAMLAHIVKKCGNRGYWTEWASNIGEIARNYIERINGLLATNSTERKVFDEFLNEIREDLNDQISEKEAIKMLGQHFVTKPVFDALFDQYEFTKLNPVSVAIQKVIDALEPKNFDIETKTLSDFYDYVRNLVSDIKTLEGKQKVVNTLYEKFFKSAFPEMTQKLGIVYTPTEVVDFIIHSVNDILKREFGQTLGSKGIHIIDPFTGTGTFITRLLQSGLITNDEIEHKFKNEIHANEIVLLAYYIAAVNIESVYNQEKASNYNTFKGICYTDTFALYEHDDWVSKEIKENSERCMRQKELDIKVIIGNPPYSTGQKNENDNNKNISYPVLDESIRQNYAIPSRARRKGSLYDSYIRAIHWASKKIGEKGGIVGFVTGNGWISKAFADAMREFEERHCSTIYLINLRGDVRKTQLNQNSTEGQNIFGQANMTGTSIVFLVKNPNKSNRGQVYYYDIGDNLTAEKKLERLDETKSIEGLIAGDKFERIFADKHGDWLNKRKEYSESFLRIGYKEKENFDRVFSNYTQGIKSNRNPWCINASKKKVEKNIKDLISVYQADLVRYQELSPVENLESVLTLDKTKIQWTRGLKNDLKKANQIDFKHGDMRIIQVAPFTKQWLYCSSELNEEDYQNYRFFPQPDSRNRSIVLSGPHARIGFSTYMTETIFEYSLIESGQGFPLQILNPIGRRGEYLDNTDQLSNVVENITNISLSHFRNKYSCNEIDHECLFYYIYGILHSEDYRTNFENNLNRELPRIPPVSTLEDFWKFVEAGRNLAELHVNYENVPLYSVKFKNGSIDVPIDVDPKSYFQVDNMKYGRDETEIIYNNNITISGIPSEAYEYEINGKSAIWWVINMQRKKHDKNSNIENNPNDFANETMNDSAYPLKLLLRAITVSLETMNIVRKLPPLNIE